MKNRSYCNRAPRRPATELSRLWTAPALLAAGALSLLAWPLPTLADAPAWMRAQVNAPVPAHDEKTDAVLLYSEYVLEVQGNGKIKGVERRVYKILRPDGRSYGHVRVYYDGETKINGIHGWCIPAQGKDYEVKDKDTIDAGLLDVENGMLFTDERERLLDIPAADPGNIVGYEIEQQDRPYVLQDAWVFQSAVPAREVHYVLQLPAGWEYHAVWLNHPEVQPVASGSNRWEWVIRDVPGIRSEDNMPPWPAVRGQMIVSFLPPGGTAHNKGFENWNEMGAWEDNLTQGRRDSSPEIKQKVAELTAGKASTLAKMQALAQFFSTISATWPSSSALAACSRMPLRRFTRTAMAIAKTRPRC